MTTITTETSTVLFTASGDDVTFQVTPTTVTFEVTGGSGPGGGASTLDELSDVDTSGKSDGDALVWDSGTSTWVADAVSGAGIPASTVNAKGDLLAATADDTVTRLAVGSNGQVLMAASGETTGLKYQALSTSDVSGAVATSRTISTTSPITGGGDLSANRTIAINDGTTSQKGAVQLEDSTSSTSTTKAATPNSVKGAYDLAAAAVPKSLADAKGDLFVASADNTVARLAVGTNGYVLTADSAETTGVKWAAGGSGVTDLDDLADVDTSGVSDGDVLTYDSGGGEWVAAAPTGGGGGLVLVDSGTVSAGSTITLDGIFTSTYDDYEFRLSILASAGANTDIRAVLRASSSDITASNYDMNGFRIYTNITADGSQGGLNQASWRIGRAGASISHIKGDLMGPNLSEHTGFFCRSVAAFTSVPVDDYESGLYKATTAADGIKFYPSSGTITGRYSIFGVPK